MPLLGSILSAGEADSRAYFVSQLSAFDCGLHLCSIKGMLWNVMFS